MSTTTMQISDRYLIFSILKDTFGIKIDQIKEVFQTDKILKLPKTSEVLSGITNLRGYILSVFDLSVLLWGSERNMTESDSRITEQHNILVVTIHGQDIGILVDEINQLSEITEFSTPDSSLLGGKELEDPSLITKIGVLSDQSNVLIVDPENALGNFFTAVKSPDETKVDDEEIDFDFDQYTLPDEESASPTNDLEEKSE
ncbi:MAG: chemotaxis protein CheW [Candidatus Hodarchaeales archaeon]|jgi:purine-binding chemotaxis protein CheW